MGAANLGERSTAARNSRLFLRDGAGSELRRGAAAPNLIGVLLAKAQHLSGLFCPQGAESCFGFRSPGRENLAMSSSRYDERLIARQRTSTGRP